MESMSIDPAVAAIGAKLIEVASRALSSGATALPAVTGLAPAGAEEVSMQAAMAFAAAGEAILAANTAAQEELARAGTALTDIARTYLEVDGAAASTLAAGASQISGSAFAAASAAGAGAGMLRAETLPGVGGLAARTPLLANLVNGFAAGVSPITLPTASSVAAAVPGAVGAASAAAGVAGTVAAPVSMISSMASGAAAGSAAGPALASSVAEDQDKSEEENPDAQQPGETLV